MKNVFIAGMCLLSTNLMAQTEKVKKIKKTNSYLMPQIALLSGSCVDGAQIQLAGGLVKNNWHLGLGTGIDYYEMRSIPLYTDVRYHFGKEKKVFAYANLGYNFHWKENTDGRMYIIPPPNSVVKNGLYTDLGIGYSLAINKNRALALSMGYSVKQLSEAIEPRSMDNFPPASDAPIVIRYAFKRVSFKVAYRLS